MYIQLKINGFTPVFYTHSLFLFFVDNKETQTFQPL